MANAGTLIRIVASTVPSQAARSPREGRAVNINVWDGHKANRHAGERPYMARPAPQHKSFWSASTYWLCCCEDTARCLCGLCKRVALRVSICTCLDAAGSGHGGTHAE